jgi:hypothetical protein
MRELIRKVQPRQQLRRLLLDGRASEPAGVANRSYFDTLPDNVRTTGR